MQTIASFRRVTPGILASAALAMREDHKPTTKAKVASALKKCAGRLGIKGYPYQILDTLLAISPAEDWTAGNRPVVAISNARLAFDLGVCEKTVSRAIRSLVEAGIVAYRDSPTGRRYVNREGGGSFGLDFSPARQRLAKLEELASAHVDEWRAMRETTRRSQGVARQIVDALEQARRDGIDVGASETQFNELIVEFHEKRANADYLASLVDLLKSVLALYEPRIPEPEESKGDNSALKEHDMSPAQDNPVPLNTSTTSPSSVRNERHHANARSVQVTSEIGSADQLAYENKPVAAEPLAQDPQRRDDDAATTLELLQLGCRQLQAEYGISLRSWRELDEQADFIRTLVQIPRDAWIAGVQVAGRMNAAAALAIVAEKVLRAAAQQPAAAEIKRPPRYFLSMLYRSPKGELHLAPTLRALAKSAMN
ncbi:plasmid replication protein RepC [Sinorhizobium sp. CCBAU 05631]|uniref:plasmid replication protein RepC n=1 Tax=Sinorhizobium sp. CCBAU 05631 TaxID=794846 RepID=UPI000BC0A4A5|nr:plasmid replication protein RepC [Sinorhizobium sp. CCBAU 05631]ASY61371.1 Plasmid replication protein RepC [Sinorhizobium sp. CCBAU 05631]